MKKAVLSAVALSVALVATTGSVQAKDSIGVTIYKYDDNFMALMRKEIEKEAKNFKDVELLMNDSQILNLLKMTKLMYCSLKE